MRLMKSSQSVRGFVELNMKWRCYDIMLWEICRVSILSNRLQSNI